MCTLGATFVTPFATDIPWTPEIGQWGEILIYDGGRRKDFLDADFRFSGPRGPAKLGDSPAETVEFSGPRTDILGA